MTVVAEEKKHPNSRKVTILRRGTFMESAQTNAAEFMSMSKKSIGSYWESKNGKATGSGLSFDEKYLLMPRIVDIPQDDRGFLPAVKAFFEAMVTPVPYDDGITLEIGLMLDNDKPITYSRKDDDGKQTFNIPIAAMDYIRYRHAQGHPRVGKSLAEAKGNMLLDFYIFDPTSVMEADVEMTRTKDKALKLYMLIREDKDPKKVDMMLTLMGKDPREFFGPDATSEKAQELRTQADTRAPRFVEEYESNMFEEKYLLTSMINIGVVRKVGNQFINADSGKILGNNMEEALYFFKDPVNTEAIAILKALMQEGLLKSVGKGTSRKRVPVGR